jgi:hypothetical protein
MLSPQAIQEFKAIYQKECGETLSDADALKLATSFFNLMKTIYRPLPDGTCLNPTCAVCLSHTPKHSKNEEKACKM